MATIPEPLPLQAVNDLYVAWKKQNPTDDASIKEFAQRYNGTAGFNLSEGANASWLSRKVMQADNLARPAAANIAGKIRGGEPSRPLSFGDVLTDPIDVAREGTARGVELMGSSAPSIALSMWSLAGGNKARALKTLGALLPYGLISGYNETRDVPHAITNAVSLAASPLLAQKAVSLAGKAGAGTVGKALAGVGGGMVGDVAEIGASPTADPNDNYLQRFEKNLPEFFKDPANVISLGVGEAAFAATEPILNATQRKIAERAKKVENIPSIRLTSGKTASVKQLLQSEFNLDIPNGVPDSTLRLAADAARMGDTQEAQRKIYASVSDRLTEQQSSRYDELKKLPEERLAEYTATVKRDWQSTEPHLDELFFEFKTDNDAREFVNQTAEQDIPENSRLVGNKLFYWGTSDESLARLSQAARSGKVNRMSLRWDKNSEFGGTPNGADIDYFGTTIKMTPSQFRRLVPPGNSDKSTIKKVIEREKKGESVAPPQLLVKWLPDKKMWQVVNHEGRSRTDAANELGETLIPVQLLPQDGMRSADITPEMLSAPFIGQQQINFGSLFASLRGSNLFRNPALQVVANITQPRIKSGGKKVVEEGLRPNKEGNYKTEAIIRAFEKRLPKDVVEHYREALPQFEVKPGYIAKDKLFEAVDKALPEVEVKNLVPGDSTIADQEARFYTAKHNIETLGYQSDEGFVGLSGPVLHTKNGTVLARQGNYVYEYTKKDNSYGELVKQSQLSLYPDAVKEYFDSYKAYERESLRVSDSDTDSSDMATGRYGVEPIPVSAMDRPVDILLRQRGENKFTSSHFGSSDKNVLASIRGYFHDKDTFFPFEIQSDWGQLKKGDEGEFVADSPYLSNYERLALQQAIVHAKEGGATRIVLPDAETVMRFEKHDSITATVFRKFATPEAASDYAIDNNIRFVPGEDTLRVSALAARNKKLEGFYLSSEKGMRFHYGEDGSLVNAMKKLGARYIGKADLGKTTTREPSFYFNGKDNITGFEFDISKVNVDEFNLFRAMQEQAKAAELLDYETQVKLTRLQEEMARRGQVMTTREFVNRVKSMTELGRAGSDFDSDVMLRALLRIAGPDKLISVFNDNRAVNGYTTKGFSSETSNVIGLNLNDSTVQEALQTVGHELTHTSLADFRRNDPEGYQQFEDAVMSIDVKSFGVLLEEANRKFGLNINVKYAVGMEFDPSSPNFTRNVAEERAAAVSEIMIGQSLAGRPTNKFLSALPIEVQRFIRNLMDKIRNWLTGDARYGRYLSEDSQKVFNEVYSRMDKQVFQSERAADKLAKMFQAEQAFDPTNLGKPIIRELSKSGVLRFKLQKDFVDDLTFMEREKLTFAQKNLQSTLSLTKDFPVARPLFERLHNYRGDIQKQLMIYFSELGQNEAHDLPAETAMNNMESWVHDLALDNKRLARISEVFEDDNNRRKGEEVLPGETIKDKLVTREEMQGKYKLTEEDSLMVTRIRDLVERVAYQEFLDMAHRSYLNQATLLLSNFGDKLSPEQAQEVGRNITMLATEAAKLDITAKRASKNDDPIKEMQTRRLANVRRADLTNRLKEELSSLGVTLGENDTRVDQAVKIALLQADYRIKHMLATAKEGYAPQIRRGNFILRSERPDGSKYVMGFNTRKEAEAAWPRIKKEEGLETAEITKKSDLGNHYRHYTSETIQGIRRQFSNELNKIIGQFDPSAMNEQTSQVLAEIQQQFGDMDAELSDALGQKADPFKLKRNDVAGFQKEDYLPNIFDYINIKTIIGQKGIIAARAKFEMSKPEFYANKDLLEQFREITDYTLNSKDSEASFPRKFIYMYYLGASMRHLFQNLTQPFIIGVPELASVTKSFTEAPRRMALAYKQVASWNSKGTTGNKALDRVMKQAEDEQLWNPTMLRHYIPTEDLSIGPISQTAYLRGKTGFGKRVRIKAAKANRAVQSALQVTAESSEILNRQIAFAARANDVKETATVNELEELYVEASRFTNDVNFIGDKSNRPGFIRRSGNFHGPLMFSTSLMSFTINQISLLMSYWGQVTKGSVDVKTYKRNPDRFRLNNPGAYGLLMGTAAVVAFAGAMGLPFSQDADEVIESVTGMRLSDMVRAGIIDLGKQFNLSEDEGDLFADAIMQGLPGAMGIGLSQSVGLGRVFSLQTGKPFSFWDLLGAGGSIAERGLSSAEAISSDPTNVENWERGIRKSLPSGLQYWHELINVVKNNQQVDTEGRIVSNPLDAGGSISRYLGFTPTEVSQQRASEFRVRRMEDRIRKERINVGRNIGRMLFDAATTSSDSKLAAARKEYIKFVRNNKLTVAQRQSLINSIADDVRSRSGQTIDIPNARMAAILSEVQGSNPSYQPEIVTSLDKRRDSTVVANQLGDPIALKLAMPPSRSIRNQMMYEQLVQSGVNPVIAKMIAEKKFEELEQMRGTSLPALRPALRPAR